MKKFKLFLIGVAAIGLSACGENVNGDEEIVSASSDVEVSTNGKTDYYEQIRTFNGKLGEFIQSTYVSVAEGDIEKKDQLIDATNEYILYLEDFNPTPVTESDKEFAPHLEDLVYDTKQLADYTLDYLFKEEKVYQDLAKDSLNSINSHLSTLKTIEDKVFTN